MALQTLQPTAPVVVTSTGLTTASTAYTAGDMLGSELTVAGMAAANGGGGVITSIQVEDHAKVIGALDLRLFNAASTPAADNAANSWSDANARLQVVAYQIAAPQASALNATVYAGNLWLPYHCAGGTTSLFLDVITLSGHTFFGAVGDLQYTFEILQWV